MWGVAVKDERVWREFTRRGFRIEDGSIKQLRRAWTEESREPL